MNPGSRSGAADGNSPARGGGGNCGGSDGGMGMDTRILHFEKMVPYLCRGSQFFPQEPDTYKGTTAFSPTKRKQCPYGTLFSRRK